MLKRAITQGDIFLLCRNSCYQNRFILPRHAASQNADTKVCNKQRVYSRGSQARRWENKSKVCLPEGQGLGAFMGYRIKSRVIREWKARDKVIGEKSGGKKAVQGRYN